MHVLWLVPNYYSFLSEEMTALAPYIGKLSVISQAHPPELVGVHPICITPTPRSVARMVRRAAGVATSPRVMPLPRSADNWRTAQSALRGNEFIADYVRDEAVDLVHSHFAYPAGTGGSMALCGRPLVLTLRGVDILTYPEIDYGFCLDPFYRRTLRKTIDRASVVTVASTTSYAAVEQCYGQNDKTIVIPNGVELDRFRKGVSGQEIRERLKLDDRPTILAVGNLVRRKGFACFIDAIGRVRRHYPTVTAIIAGDGEERESLERQITESGLDSSVRLIGTVSRQEMPRFFAACDIFVHPSVVEGFGNVVLEAMAMERPVIATDTGVAADLIRDGQNGLIVPPNSADALAEAIHQLLEDRASSKQIGVEAARTVERGFSMQDRASSFTSVYERAIASSRH